MNQVLIAFTFILIYSCNSAVDVDLTSRDTLKQPVPVTVPVEEEIDTSKMGDILWSKSFGGSSSDTISAIHDTGNEIVLCGQTRSAYSLDGISIDANTSQDEMYTAKCSRADCTFSWFKTSGKKGSRSYCSNIDSDSSGEIYSIGTYYTDINFGSGDLGNNGDRDLALVKYSNSGTLVWANSFGGTAGEEFSGLTITDTDDVYTSGFFRNTVDFGSGGITSAGDADAFISKYNTVGTHQSVSKYGLGSKDYFWDLASDGSGNVYATGEMIGSIDVGGGALSQIGGRDIYLAKYAPNGSHVWSIIFGGTGEEYTRDLAINSSGQIVVAGTSKGTFNVAGIGHTNQGGNDIVLVMVDSDSTILWAKAFGNGSEDQARDVVIDNDGNIILLATFSGTLNVGGDNLLSNGGQDFLIAKYDSSGNHLYSKHFGGTSNDSANSIKIDSDNNILIAGSFNSSMTIGDSIHVSNGSSDSFILSMKNK